MIRTRDIRVKSPLPYRLATDANQYSVFGISPSVFVLFFSSFLILLFIFFICPRHKCREHQLMRRDLNPQNPSVNSRTRYLLRHASIFLYGQKISHANRIQPNPYAKWSIRESNPPPPACKTGVAPLRLMPHIRRQPSCRHI